MPARSRCKRWVEAREKSDFSIFLPYLKKNVDLQHRYIGCFEGQGDESEYDVLLDDFDEGLKTDAVREVFDELKRASVPLIAEIGEHADRVDDSTLTVHLPDRGRSGTSRSWCSSGSASTTTAGGSTRLSTRSR